MSELSPDATKPNAQRLTPDADVVFIGMEPWGTVWRRSHNLMAAYARRFPQRNVLFVAAPHDLTFALRAGRSDIWKTAVRSPRLTQAGGLPNLHILTPLKILPHSLPFGKTLNQAVPRHQVRQAMNAVGMDSPVLWIKPHWGAHYAGKLKERCVIYDVGDDWTAIQQSARAMRWAKQEDDWLTRRADAVVVVSEHLKQLKQPVRQDDVTIIPNGVNTALYADVWKCTLPVSPRTREWQQPVLGYTGMLHVERLDVDLVLATARAFPASTVALVGPNLLDETTTAKLAAEPNIRLTGAVPHEELPSVMSSFAVCLVPNLVNAFSESQNPLKMFEYLASGLPIVSTPVSGFRDHAQWVTLADTPDTFIAGIHSALAEGTLNAAARQAAVQGETWDARIEAFVEVIGQATLRHKAAME